MAYVKAIALALLAAVVVGAATAAWRVVQAIRPEEKATVLSLAISAGVNCVAFYTMVLIPLLVGIVFVRRRLRR